MQYKFHCHWITQIQQTNTEGDHAKETDSDDEGYQSKGEEEEEEMDLDQQGLCPYFLKRLFICISWFTFVYIFQKSIDSDKEEMKKPPPPLVTKTLSQLFGKKKEEGIVSKKRKLWEMKNKHKQTKNI